MSNGTVPAALYDQRAALCRRIDALESGRIRVGKGPRLVSDDDSQAALESARQQLAELDAIIAEREEDTRA